MDILLDQADRVQASESTLWRRYDDNAFLRYHVKRPVNQILKSLLEHYEV